MPSNALHVCSASLNVVHVPLHALSGVTLVGGAGAGVEGTVSQMSGFLLPVVSEHTEDI